MSTTGGTITRLFDKLGRQISYIDADGGVTTVEFDKLDRPVKVADSVPSTTTYTYDDAAEPRGLATSFTDSVAGVFRTSYDAFVSRRGGGVAKNGYRYMGLLHQRPGHAYANRFLVFYSATYAETWGTPPGKRGKMRKLQSKGSWMNPGKLGWAVHYNIQVKPGTRIWTYGAVVVAGWYRGYAADMSYSCMAAS